MHHFGKGFDGSRPDGPLILDSGGNIYGATQYGGRDGGGAVFELSASSDGEWVDNLIAPPPRPRGFRPLSFKPPATSEVRFVRNAPQAR